MFEDLIYAWSALRSASVNMVAVPVPAWPWDRTDPAFIKNQRLRDRVQGRGMRFASLWNAHAQDIAALVAADAATYREFHVKPPKGDLPDPTSYMQSGAIMPRLIAGITR